MVRIWDYDIEELKKTEQGRILILERLINYGPEEGEKISVKEVKKYWDKLRIFPKMRRLLELIIWRKTTSSPKSSKLFFPK